MPGGRPRVDVDQHKELILQLYQTKTPWAKIEDILLTQHGCKIKAKSIHRRFKEWDTSLNRVYTDETDALKDQIRSYWADRSTRPKTDDELHRKLWADGFTVSLTAVARIRSELRLFRRWDHKLGRVRPDEEVDERKGRRKQKWPAFTDAVLAPPPDTTEEPRVQPQPSQRQTSQPERSGTPASRRPRQRRHASPARPAVPTQPTQIAYLRPLPQPHQDQPPLCSAADQSSAFKDAYVTPINSHCLGTSHSRYLPLCLPAETHRKHLAD